VDEAKAPGHPAPRAKDAQKAVLAIPAQQVVPTPLLQKPQHTSVVFPFLPLYQTGNYAQNNKKQQRQRDNHPEREQSSPVAKKKKHQQRRQEQPLGMESDR
jgi:hypothetical protein